MRNLIKKIRTASVLSFYFRHFNLHFNLLLFSAFILLPISVRKKYIKIISGLPIHKLCTIFCFLLFFGFLNDLNKNMCCCFFYLWNNLFKITTKLCLNFWRVTDIQHTEFGKILTYEWIHEYNPDREHISQYPEKFPCCNASLFTF